MKRIKSIFRIAVIVALSLVGVILLFGEEHDADLSKWAIHFLADKAMAALSLAGAFFLYMRWHKTDEWLMAYERTCEEVWDETV